MDRIRFSSLAIITVSMAFCATTVVGQVAQAITVDMMRVSDDGIGEKIGTVILSQTRTGLTMTVDITGLTAGRRGFHVHETGDCAPAMKDGKLTAAEAAGAHYDPDRSKSHRGPKGPGHRGDLPVLTGSDNSLRQVVNTARLKLADIRGRSLVIHLNDDNYTDKPESGGSGARVACGVVPR
jgi:Cu-Zn family superoxide dismutase